MEITKDYTISFKELFETFGPQLTYGYIDTDQGYYDYRDQNGNIVAMDGEANKLIHIDLDKQKLTFENTESELPMEFCLTIAEFKYSQNMITINPKLNHYAIKAKPLYKEKDDNYYQQIHYLVSQGYYKNGYVYGYLTDNYVMGPVIEANTDYIIHDFWMPIDLETVQSYNK